MKCVVFRPPGLFLKEGGSKINSGFHYCMFSLLLQTLDEALKENSDNVHPYIIYIGSITAFSSAVAVCNKKVVTTEIGRLVFSSILTYSVEC